MAENEKPARHDSGLRAGADGRPRCFWHGGLPDYEAYHDREWGRPVSDDFRLFEKICLEGFQSGLSWLTILRKRDNFRRAFADFDFHEVARFSNAEIERLMADAGIVRHRGKIEAAIGNARCAIELAAEHGSLAAYFWRHEPGEQDRPKRMTKQELLSLSSSPVSTEISKDLKKRGWRFVGPTTIYAFMQAMGLVNDHLEGCCIRAECETERAAFERPA